MKRIIKLLLFVTLIFSVFTTSAQYNEKLNTDPVFMEKVYSFIWTDDITTNDSLNYCEQVYLEATRRREYTGIEIIKCWNYFTQKNNEEKAYMEYMFNNRELFY
jgi:hypothetical protein